MIPTYNVESLIYIFTPFCTINTNSTILVITAKEVSQAPQMVTLPVSSRSVRVTILANFLAPSIFLLAKGWAYPRQCAQMHRCFGGLFPLIITRKFISE